jgi:nucleoid-associated protein YgaU
MGLLGFIREAGEKLFSKAQAQGTDKSAASAVQESGAANAKAADAIKAHIAGLKLAPPDLALSYAGGSETVTLRGTAPDQATREKIILAAGNVEGVASVDDQMTVTKQEPQARFHTVVRGDTLSAISKQYYGSANKYVRIFEAKKPMLSHPDKIYPGQVLRIPEQS